MTEKLWKATDRQDSDDIWYNSISGSNNKPQFARPAAAQKAAALLGTTVEELSRQIFASDGTILMHSILYRRVTSARRRMSLFL